MESSIKILWREAKEVPSKQYRCGHCGSLIASHRGFTAELGTGINGERWSGTASIHLCPFCTRPTFFDPAGRQTPGVPSGDDVRGIDDPLVEKLYSEARRATSANCHTAAVLCCRKLLMHVAVAKGAKQNEGFMYYVQYLIGKCLAKDTEEWVNHIKQKGNEANHEIVLMKQDETEQLLVFVGMLLKVIYEFPAAMRNQQTPSAKQK